MQNVSFSLYRLAISNAGIIAGFAASLGVHHGMEEDAHARTVTTERPANRERESDGENTHRGRQLNEGGGRDVSSQSRERSSSRDPPLSILRRSSPGPGGGDDSNGRGGARGAPGRSRSSWRPQIPILSDVQTRSMTHTHTNTRQVQLDPRPTAAKSQPFASDSVTRTHSRSLHTRYCKYLYRYTLIFAYLCSLFSIMASEGSVSKIESSYFQILSR
jgi:hypothetical protein